MKWLLLLIVILAFIGYLVYRYRKYLQTALFMYRTVRQMKRQSTGQQKQVPPRDTSKDSELVRCPRCGKWASKMDSVKLKSDFFCSHSCMEESIMASRTR